MTRASPDGRVRVGVVGCGTIAQIAHLPFLRELRDRFTIGALCDVVPGTLQAVAEQYGVPAHARFSEVEALCASDLVDAVMVCSSGSHVPAAVAALEAGKHVIVEKPLTGRLSEAQRLVEVAGEARRRSGAVALMAYMKRFDPGYRYGQRLIRPMVAAGQVAYVDARHIHAHNPLYEQHHTLWRGAPPPRTPGGAAEPSELGEDATPNQRRVLNGIGSSIHDLYCLTGLLGRPEGIIASDVNRGGRAALFQFPRGVVVNYAWIDIGPLRDFRQEIVCYGGEQEVTIRFPQPYLLSAPTTCTVRGMEPAPEGADDPGAGHPAAGLSRQDPGPPQYTRVVTASYQDAYKLEWVHFHDCITRGVEPLTTVQEARDDTAFFVEWARATRPGG